MDELRSEGVEFYELPEDEAERWYASFSETLLKMGR